MEGWYLMEGWYVRGAPRPLGAVFWGWGNKKMAGYQPSYILMNFFRPPAGH